MNKEHVLDELQMLIEETVNINDKNTRYDETMEEVLIIEEIYDTFLLKVITLLKKVMKYKDDENINNIKQLTYNSKKNLLTIQNILKNIKKYVDKGYIELDLLENNHIELEKVKILETIFSNFHKMAIKMRERHSDRTTLDINDEYDVQDLLYATLQLFFEDIRREEWTPSYAGNSARVDFLLKNEEIVIEVKKTRSSMKDKDLGEQLIVDIAKYKKHPHCKKLICFVYDPDGRIGNPTGMINDLERENESFVKVYINPKI